MDMTSLRRGFNKLGAELDVEIVAPRWLRWRKAWQPQIADGFSLDIVDEGSRDERYLLRIDEDSVDSVRFVLADVRPKLQHLLLIGRTNTKLDKFLCGHDERHWFVAPVEQRVTNVQSAFESLRPALAQREMVRMGVRPKNRNKRRNAAFVRQGEWFFIPRIGFVVPNQHLILRNEPLSRGRGSKPHMVEEVYRFGGETVYVSWRYKDGLPISVQRYERLIQRKPELRHYHWQMVRRNPTVYARGKVRHGDHKTIKLPYWHEVAMATEKPNPRVVFLD